MTTQSGEGVPVDVQALFEAYDAEIGRLNGTLLRERAAHAATLGQMAQRLADADHRAATAQQVARELSDRLKQYEPEDVSTPQNAAEAPAGVDPEAAAIVARALDSAPAKGR